MMEKLSKKVKVKKEFKKKKTSSQNKRKKTDKTKRGRLFIKNLPFKITEEEFKKHFEQYGNIIDVQLLKNAEGKLKGCGFINYEKKLSAVQAIIKSNNKPFKDRSIQVDWAVPKTKFEKDKKGSSSAKKEEIGDDDDKDEIHVMDVDSETEEKPDVKEEDNDSEIEVKSEKSNDDDNNEDDNDDENGSDEDVEIKEEEDKVDTKDNENKKKFKSNDITERKTVFIRNLPFHINNNRLKQIMHTEFGPSFMYALVCVDALTEHSKGTAFVKFKTVEDAEKCINKGSLVVDGETITFHAAVDRKQILSKKDEKQKQFKDSRNLYLVKEGVVIAGSKAAEGVSVTDMTKRVQLEQWKTQMLRNLHMFVSKTRLIIHNLPPEYDDRQLRTLFKKHSPPNAVIREAKVMRNIRDLDDKGVGKSKEHGFVSYTTHEDALQALRNVNNNPNVFSKSKRPVVAFSIENRAILNAKMKRTEKSKEKNPLYREKYLNEKKQQLQQQRGRLGGKQKYTVDKSRDRNNQNTQDQGEYKGMVSKPTQNITFSKNHKLSKQLDLHKINIQKSKKDQRKNKKKREVRSKTKDPFKTKQKHTKIRNVDNEDKQFNKLISSYKSKISSANNNLSIKKWYDT